jgi:hypothetical protein
MSCIPSPILIALSRSQFPAERSAWIGDEESAIMSGGMFAGSVLSESVCICVNLWFVS